MCMYNYYYQFITDASYDIENLYSPQMIENSKKNRNLTNLY